MTQKLPSLLDQVAESTTTGSPASEQTAVEVPGSAAVVEEASSIDWGKEAEEMDGDEREVVVAPETPAVPATTETPAKVEEPKAPAVVPAAAPSVAAPAEPAAAPAQAVVPEAPKAPAPPAKSAEQLEADRVAAANAAKADEENRRKELVDYYKLPEDLAVQLQTEPENVLPQLAAKIHQTVAKNLVTTINEMLPQLVRNIQHMEESEVRSKNAFYARWPKLADREREVLEVGALYRKLNPNAPAAEAIERIGRTVCETLGIPIEAAMAATATAAAAAQAAPAAQQQVFTPAGGGGGARVVPPASDNVFNQLADEFLAEDRG